MHDFDNLQVVGGSFFVSSGTVNPTLTIVANELRVGDHLIERMGTTDAIDVIGQASRTDNLHFVSAATAS